MHPFTLIPLIGQVFLLIMACFALLVSAIARHTRQQHVYHLVQFALLAAIFFFWYFGLIHPAFYPPLHFVADRLSVISNIFICASTFILMIYAKTYLLQHRMPLNEFSTLILFAVLGMTVLTAANNLLLLYLGLECLALSSYVLVALRRENKWAIEAATKYFIMGAIASGLLLYGMSMIFGATHTLDLQSIAHTMHVMGYHHNPILLVGLIFLIAGVAFKLGVAPFHMWVPDVYDGAPAPVSMFIATAPKIAALVLFIRLFAEGLAVMHITTTHVVIVLAILSMAVGNIGALRQTQIKRLLGYSSIAHMGYILLALACGTQQGYASAYFYMISYAVMTLVAFGAISLLSHHGKDVIELGSLRGLNSQHPWLAFVLLMAFFSMAGIPPLVGFMAKLGILEALIHVHLTWLAVVAIIFAIIGAYYYLRVVKVMYFEIPEDDSGLTLAKHGRLVLSLNGILVLVLGLMPGVLFTLCHSIQF